METQAKKLLKKLGVGVAASVASIGYAVADVDPAVTTKLTESGADAATIGGSILVLIIGIAAFKYMRRAV